MCYNGGTTVVYGAHVVLAVNAAVDAALIDGVTLYDVVAGCRACGAATESAQAAETAQATNAFAGIGASSTFGRAPGGVALCELAESFLDVA